VNRNNTEIEVSGMNNDENAMSFDKSQD